MARLSAKTTANLVIVAILAILVVTPLSYYTTRDDSYDERFAWRMFSPIRMVRCKVDLEVGDPPSSINLYRTFHEAWITIAQRGRLAVLRRMVERVCAENPGQPVRMHLPCRQVDGKVVDAIEGRADLCKEGL